MDVIQSFMAEHGDKIMNYVLSILLIVSVMLGFRQRSRIINTFQEVLELSKAENEYLREKINILLEEQPER